ncbi:hypothetical protein OLR81_00240, partial [Campylobacter jejuni]|nr:hypothetical protein [Campylobacter jejuni]
MLFASALLASSMLFADSLKLEGTIAQ